jgi:hypothetical protein
MIKEGFKVTIGCNELFENKSNHIKIINQLKFSLNCTDKELFLLIIFFEFTLES